MDNQLVIDAILNRINTFDSKLDTSIKELQDDMNTCKLDIKAVKINLTNHLDNKKSESERSNRQFYVITAIIGVMFSTYVTIKELF